MRLKSYLRQALLLLSIFISITLISQFNELSVESRVFVEEAKSEKKSLPRVNWARSRKIDLKHVVIDLKFDWAKKQAYGTTTLTFTPFNSTDEITLDAAFFVINSVISQNGTSLKFDYEGGDKNDNLKIALERVYQAGEEVAIKIDYRTNWVNETDPANLGGSFGKGIRFFEPTSSDVTRPKEIWSMGEPQGNRYWFPSYDSPNDLRTTEFIATVDKNLTAISNGKLIKMQDNLNGTRMFHWKADTPYANYLTSFIVGEYINTKQDYEGIELNNFGYPSETEAVKASVVRLPDMVKYFSDVTGVKYPYSSYSQVFVQDFGGFMGGNALSTITENMIDDERTHADFFYLWDLTEAEALAHQWFGNYLTSQDWSQIWLNKSFAHYFNCLYNEHKNGKEEFLLFQHSFDLKAVYLGDWDSGYRRPVITKHYADTLAFTGDNYSTVRGSLVLHMLRKHLGEEKWWKAIKLYVKSNANKLVSTESFREAVEEVSGEPMDWFFDQWLYKMGHPVFEVAKSYNQTTKQLTLTVKQTQKLDLNDEYPQVEFFQGKIDIEIDGQIKQVYLQPKGENVFSFILLQEPKLVNFDYENTWIKEIKFEKPLDELLYQLEKDKDVLGKRWALDQLVNFAQREKVCLEDKEKIYQGLRSVVLSDSYWRLRLSAISQLQILIAPPNQTKAALIDEATIAMLLSVIKNEKSWNRAAAINFLGTTQDPKYADIYLKALEDESDRVINRAAVSLGKSKSPKAFEALAKLVNKPSWKNQSLMSSLNGLKELGDPRGFEVAFKALSDPYLLRWRLPSPPVWDFRVFAVETIASLERSDTVSPFIFERLKKSIDENDINGIFNNTMLLTKLPGTHGQQAFEMLKARFKDDENIMAIVKAYETQFNEALKR